MTYYLRKGEIEEDEIPDFRAKEELTESEITVRYFEEQNSSRVQISDLADYASCKLDIMILEKCSSVDKEVKSALQYTQNMSICIFFVLVHIPLTKFSAAWSFLTAFTVWFLDTKTKEYIYHLVGFITRVFTD